MLCLCCWHPPARTQNNYLFLSCYPRNTSNSCLILSFPLPTPTSVSGPCPHLPATLMPTIGAVRAPPLLSHTYPPGQQRPHQPGPEGILCDRVPRPRRRPFVFSASAAGLAATSIAAAAAAPALPHWRQRRSGRRRCLLAGAVAVAAAARNHRRSYYTLLSGEGGGSLARAQ